MDAVFLHQQAREVSTVLKTLSNEKRLQILCALSDGEKSVGELEPIVGLSQSALSQHLSRLRKDKIVKTRRDAQTIYYSLACSTVKNLLRSFCAVFKEKI